MISARRKAELAEELQNELDTVDRLEVQAKDDAHDRKKEIILHRQKVRQLRDLLAGREVAQSTLPGTETGTMISARRKAELAEELQNELDTVDRLEVQAKDDAHDRKKEIILHRQKVRQLRDLLAGREVAQSSLPGTETGTVKPRPAAPKKSEAKAMRDAADEFVAQLRKGELTRWIADARAKRVPTFVIEQTGIRTKAGIIAKWGDNAVFEKGKPCPRDRDGLQSWERKPAKGRKKAEPCSRCRSEDAETTMEGQRVCWSCAYKVQEEAEAARKANKARVAAGERAARGEILWAEAPDADGVTHGTTYDLLKVEVWLASGGWKWSSNTRMKGAVGFGSETLAKVAAEEAERERCAPEKGELCLDCGIAAGKPSPGCEGCLHPEAA